MALRTNRPRLNFHDTRTARPRPKQADAELLTQEHRVWRQAVCKRAGWRCEWVENGQRCQASASKGYVMVADHVIERADGGALYDEANGQCLCVSHNTLKGNRSRAVRAASGVGDGGLNAPAA